MKSDYGLSATREVHLFMHLRLACGAAIIVDGRIILLKRKCSPETGHWALPAGKVHVGEHISYAACREVMEELGVSISADDLLCNHSFDDIEAGIRWLAHIYYASSYDGIPFNAEPHKHEEIGWFPLDQLPHPLSCFVVVALSILKKRQEIPNDANLCRAT